jgi:hypothetical protein
VKLIFIYGPVAAGKLTIAKVLAEKTGFGLFHNHLIVDAVLSVFPFGSPEFIRLRETFWLETFETAASAQQSLIFTFAPEPSVATDFPDRAAALVEKHGGEVFFVRLEIDPAEQERRLVSEDRSRYMKLRSLDILREMRAETERCLNEMPRANFTIDVANTAPDEAARLIANLVAL